MLLLLNFIDDACIPMYLLFSPSLFFRLIRQYSGMQRIVLVRSTLKQLDVTTCLSGPAIIRHAVSEFSMLRYSEFPKRPNGYLGITIFKRRDTPSKKCKYYSCNNIIAVVRVIGKAAYLGEE